MSISLKSVSRAYGVILALLPLVVTVASFALVSLVRSDVYYDQSLHLTTDLKMLSQRLALYAGLETDAPDPRTRRQANVLFEETLNEFRMDTQQLHAMATMTPAAFGRFSGAPQMGADVKAYIAGTDDDATRGDSLISRLNDYADAIEAGPADTKDAQSERRARHMLKALGYGEALLKAEAEAHFIRNKNVLLACVYGFIIIIGLEAVLIYLPFSRRIARRAAALQKEQDILVKSRAALAQSEERLQLALGGISAGIVDWLIADDVLYLSDTARAILSLDNLPQGENEDLKLNDLRNAIGAQNAAVFDFRLSAHLDSHRTFALELNIAAPEAPARWVSIRAQAQWQDGRPVRLSGTVEDITARKQAEDLKRIFVAGIEASKLAVSIIDVTAHGHRFMYVSPGFCDLLGYDRKRLEASNLYMLNGPETALEALDRLDSIIENGESASLEIIHYRGDGSPFIDKMTLTPARDGPGRVLAYVAVHEDVSLLQQRDRKAIERQRHEALGRIAGHVANEIAAELELMPKSKKDNGRIRALIDGLRGLSQPDNEKAQKIDLVAEMAVTLDFVRALSEDRFPITAEGFDGQSAPAAINTAELRQVITNIVRNAQQSYGSEGGGIVVGFEKTKISMGDARRLGIEHSGLDYYLVSVTDKGEGMTPEVVRQAFDPLFSTRLASGATGLGLTVAQAILRAWGGEISLDSAPGEGTSVYLYIPVPAAEADADFMEMSDLLDELNALS